MMSFEKYDPLAIASDNGDAIVPGKTAVAIATQEANETGKALTIRDAISDKVLATVKPNGAWKRQSVPSNLMRAAKAGVRRQARDRAASPSVQPHQTHDTTPLTASRRQHHRASVITATGGVQSGRTVREVRH